MVGYDDSGLQGISNRINDITGRAFDEASVRKFWKLNIGADDLLMQASPFGPDVGNAFPLAQEDISEAAKCLALERSTAAVFHLMRAMECAVQALAAKLAIPNQSRVWGNLLSDMNKKIAEMPKGPERTKWSEVHAHLYHVKEAWRNETMHPKQTYTAEEASAVFAAARVFMRSLSALV